MGSLGIRWISRKYRVLQDFLQLPQAAHSTVCGYFQRVITGTFGKTCGDSTAFPQVWLWIISLPSLPLKMANNPLVNHFFRTPAKGKTPCNLFAGT